MLTKEVRFSHELPNDEGFVFVTNVPGAPFQLIGRRGRCGGLFVDSFLIEGPVAKPSAEVAKNFEATKGIPVELVEGPEAEELLAAMIAHLKAKLIKQTN